MLYVHHEIKLNTDFSFTVEQAIEQFGIFGKLVHEKVINNKPMDVDL